MMTDQQRMTSSQVTKALESYSIQQITQAISSNPELQAELQALRQRNFVKYQIGCSGGNAALVALSVVTSTTPQSNEPARQLLINLVVNKTTREIQDAFLDGFRATIIPEPTDHTPRTIVATAN